MPSKQPFKTTSMEDSIYSVPQYSELDLVMNNIALLDNESSVDDSIDYSDVIIADSNCKVLNEQNGGTQLINRSLSIPSSVLFNGSTVGGDKANAPPPPPPPPPLPPRASNLDRSNSLNSGNNHQSRPLISIRNSVNSTVPFSSPSPPPILPQRPIRRVVQNQSNLNEPPQCAPPPPPPLSSAPTTHFQDLDGLEFENLVLSSPTPVSQTTSNRPAPIIGIEINNENGKDVDLMSVEQTILKVNPSKNATLIDSKQPETNNGKSNSLPRDISENGLRNE